jgi:hypothetical protein
MCISINVRLSVTMVSNGNSVSRGEAKIVVFSRDPFKLGNIDKLLADMRLNENDHDDIACFVIVNERGESSNRTTWTTTNRVPNSFEDES